jgi:phosphoglycolate phosphatase
MKLIGIDLDGTLEDSRADMVASSRRVRAALDLPPRADAQLRPHVNAGMDQLYRACFDDFLAGGDAVARMRQLRDAYEADYLAHVAVETRLYDGIAAALAALAELGSLACITNKPERISRALLDALGVGGLFGAVIGGDSCAQAKPSPLMLEAAAQHCGFERTRGTAFMIGDTNADLELARAFGATSIWCAWGYVDAPSVTPDHRAQRPQELPRIVARLR